MIIRKFSILAVAIVAISGVMQSCSIEPEYFSEATPELFFDSQQKVYQRAGRPFTHWAWAETEGTAHSYFKMLQEFTTDEMVLPSRYNDWFDGGDYLRLYMHDFSPTMRGTYDLWRGFSTGVAHAWSAKEDIDKYADFEALGFEEGAKEAITMELQSLAAYFYLVALDAFGGVPLYTSNSGGELSRSTDVETFNFIDSLLTEAIPHLDAKVLGDEETGKIHQAAAVMMKARLYFNAEAYIGVDMYDECAKLCKDIIDGKYGAYELDSDWTHIFGFDNQKSPEIIWSVPSENAYSERGVGRNSIPYGMDNYWNNGTVGGRNNGYCLVPSLDVNGKSYVYGSSNPSTKGSYKLGSPFAKFQDSDIRKQLHAYEGDGNWRGMFLFGELVNPVTGDVCYGGGREVLSSEAIHLVDQVAIVTPKKDNNGNVINADILGNEGARWGEENSGIRLMKFSPIPWGDNANLTLRGNPDMPVMRISETYYMLAECKLRAGEKDAAAALINSVKARYFVSGDPDPVTAANLDEWRMLDEWMIEFIEEGRRRTDLIRWNKYTTQSWWGHEADGEGKEYLRRFPLAEGILAGNQLLVQNPGY